jgi:Tol biopolymer transport system component
VSGDTLPESTDIFVRDTIAGTTEVISTRSNGVFSASQFRFATEPAISADGRYVAFMAVGSDFVPGDTNNELDVFVKDRVTGITTRVSTDSNGNQGIDLINADSLGSSAVEDPSISADGRYVAFRSSFYNLVANDINQLNDIFVKDRLTGITTRVSVDSNADQANGTSYNPDISADGRYATFASAASNLVDGDVLGAPDVFVHDRLSGTTRLF